MNQAHQYPTKFKNVLIEAGLIGVGELVIQAMVAGGKKTTLDEDSDTWVQSEEYEIDFRGAGEYFCPVDLGGDRVAGDWTNGLDQKTIKAIHEECGVPKYDKNTSIYIYDGKRYDMSNPVHMAEYMILNKGRVVAEKKSLIQAGQRFYFVSTKEVEQEKAKVRQLKTRAIQLSGQLDANAKREMLRMINFKWKLGIPDDLNERGVHDAFTDMALGDHYLKIVQVYDMKDRRFYALLYKAISHGILISNGEQGAISNPGAKEPIALDHDKYVQMLKADGNMYSTLVNRLEAIMSASNVDESVLPQKVERVKHYDTTISEEGDVGFWGVKACQQYVEEKNWIASISPADGVEKWRKLVLDIYHGRASVYGNDGRNMMDDKKVDFTDTSQPASLSTDVKSNFISTVQNWNREDCRKWLDEQSALVEEKEFVHTLNGNSSTDKWRGAVTDFIKLLNEKEIGDLLAVKA